MDLGFAGAATVVVGGGRGMGFATARCLAEDGARIAIVGRSRDVLDAAATELARLGSPEAVAIVADTAATRRLIQAASSIARSLKNSVYQRSDQPPHTVTSREALKE